MRSLAPFPFSATSRPGWVPRSRNKSGEGWVGPRSRRALTSAGRAAILSLIDVFPSLFADRRGFLLRFSFRPPVRHPLLRDLRLLRHLLLLSSSESEVLELLWLLEVLVGGDCDRFPLRVTSLLLRAPSGGSISDCARLCGLDVPPGCRSQRHPRRWRGGESPRRSCPRLGGYPRSDSWSEPPVTIRSRPRGVAALDACHALFSSGSDSLRWASPCLGCPASPQHVASPVLGAGMKVLLC